MSEADVRKALAAAAAAAAASKPPPPETKSRSGRTVKRSTFHDEFGQGMQMLKTSQLMKHLHANSSDADGSDASDDDTKQSAIIPGSVDAMGPRSGSATAPVAAAFSVSGASVSLKAPPGQAAAASATAGATLQMTNYPGLHAAASASALSSTSTIATRGATNLAHSQSYASRMDSSKQPRRKPGARECMQISRRFGVKEIPEKYIEILMDYKDRGKLEHLIRMRERLDEHSRFLEAQLAGLEALVLEKGESDVVVPLGPPEDE